ncbi:MAG: hypothetical protein J5781_07815 [Clostridia bacterium]|nr:hypothetical protein [Clostridia bacterium]
MCKRRKKQDVPQVPYVENETVSPVAESAPELPQEKDYFNEYYKAYKNDYIEQYLHAYHKYKETGEIDDTMRELQGFDSDMDDDKDLL